MNSAKKLGITLVLTTYDNLRITFSNTSHIMTINSHNIESFDLVFFRTVGNFIEEQTLISEHCRTHRIPVIDSVFSHSKPWIDRKSFEYQRLKTQDVPIIPTHFVSKSSFSEIASKITYPVIAKITDGSKGEGVYKCKSQQELNKIFLNENKALLVQEYIKNHGDIRVFVIGNEIQGAIKRTSANLSEFRNNVSLGGTTEIYHLNQEEQEMVFKAVKALEYEIAGVDLIYDENNNLYVMEVNRAPQFNGFMAATSIDIPFKILEYLLTQCK